MSLLLAFYVGLMPRLHQRNKLRATSCAQQAARNLMLVSRNKLRVARNTQLDAGNTQLVAGNKHNLPVAGRQFRGINTLREVTFPIWIGHQRLES